MTTVIAKGEFEVSLDPQQDDSADAGGFTRMVLRKTFTGDMQGESVGQMLGARYDNDNAAGYVAMEKFTGTVHGKQGSFLLQHFGRIQEGDQFLDIMVVPGSGSGDLQGIQGVLVIVMQGERHGYEFDYEILPA